MHNTSPDQIGASGPKNVQKTAKRSLGARHPNYWLSRVFLGQTTRDGRTYYTSNYYVKIQYAGRRELFCLDTADKAEAAKLAETIYCVVRSGPTGWDQAIDRYKKKMVVHDDDATVGDYLHAVKTLSGMRPETFARYAGKLRRVAASIGANENARKAKKYDARGKGRAEWIAAVEAIPLRELNDDAVRRWQVAYVAGRSINPVEEKKARHTIDSVLRSCKCLFAQKVVKWIKHLRLPNPLPFRSLDYMTRGTSSYRFRSRTDPVALLAAARAELRLAKPECYKIFLMALGAGLRRYETDRLRWDSVLVEQSVLRVEEHAFFEAKSEFSLADVPVEKELIEELLALRHPGDEYVVHSKNSPRNGVTYRYYRCEYHFSELCQWLRSHGLDVENPIHTLRKEYGRLLNEGFGIYAASHALRHSSVQVTAIFYADDTRRIVPSLLGRKPAVAPGAPTTQLSPSGTVVAG